MRQKSLALGLATNFQKLATSSVRFEQLLLKSSQSRGSTLTFSDCDIQALPSMFDSLGALYKMRPAHALHVAIRSIGDALAGNQHVAMLGFELMTREDGKVPVHVPVVQRRVWLGRTGAATLVAGAAHHFGGVVAHLLLLG
jgi:hypothetical protein